MSQDDETFKSEAARVVALSWSDIAERDPATALTPEQADQLCEAAFKAGAEQAALRKLAEDEMDKRQAREREELIAYLESTRLARAQRLVEEEMRLWADQVLTDFDLKGATPN